MKPQMIFLAIVLLVSGALSQFANEQPLPPQPSPLSPGPRFGYPTYGAQVGGVVAPDGKTEMQCDLPEKLQVKNTGGSDGAGLCVFTSIMHSARYQHVNQLEDFQTWMKKYPGGGWPEKVKRMITKLCQEKGVPEPPYLQVTGKDLQILKDACASGRMPAVTYSHSPTGRYGGGRIAHMVSLPHADNTWFAVLDNNYIGAKAYEWMSPAEFLSTYADRGDGWSVILLDPGPPAPPRNR